MFLKSLDLTTALRPLLLPDEALLFAQDGVGLYEGYALMTTNCSGLTDILIESTKFQVTRMVMPT